MSLSIAEPAAPPAAVPRVSVIVPVRNDAAHLRASLEALRNSSFPDYEVIVVDDASTDDTPEWIRAQGVRSVRLDRRSGPAAARNRGAEAARGELLVFIDADVCVAPRTVEQFVRDFEEDPQAAAVFGSYDSRPRELGALSQYKNLMHHRVHQEGNREASTFWAGCGAVRRSVFRRLDGFCTDYGRPCIEDIELGVRMRNAGYRIVLDKDIQVTHLKRWTFWGILRTDVLDRAIPWSQLILREGKLPDDLNLKLAQRLCALLAWALLAAFAVACWHAQVLLLIPAAILGGTLFVDAWSARRRVPTAFRAAAVLGMIGVAVAIVLLLGYWAIVLASLLAAIVLLNGRLLRFFGRRHPLFAVLAVPMLHLYYLYSSGAFAVCVLWAAGARLRAIVRNRAPRAGSGPRG